MADFGLGSILGTITYQGRVNGVLFTENNGWKLIQPYRIGWPAGYLYGQWKHYPARTVSTKNTDKFFPASTGFYQEGRAGQESALVFKIGRAIFPIDESLLEGSINALYCVQNPDKPEPCQLDIVISGKLLVALERYEKECQEELNKLLRDLPAELVSLVDPTGAACLYLAGKAFSEADLFGCAMNLVGAVPLFGKLAKARNMEAILQRAQQLARILERIAPRIKWSAECSGAVNLAECRLMNFSVCGKYPVRWAAGKISHTTEELTHAKEWLRLKVAGVVRSVVTYRKLSAAGKLHRIENAAELGLFDSELRALRLLADAGIYFVIRSCNKDRVRLINKAMELGARLNAKIGWIKAKTLKSAGALSGLVGYSHAEVTGLQLLGKEVTDASSLSKEFMANIRFIEDLTGKRLFSKNDNVLSRLAVFKAAPRTGTKIVEGKEVSVLKDFTDEAILDHYWIRYGNHYVLVDGKGAATCSDIDIVAICENKGGVIGKPGVNVGVHPVRAFKRPQDADDAQFTAYWNMVFQKIAGCRYPKGYTPFGGWHSGRGGTVAFGLWSVEKAEEKLVVACKGVEGLGDSVGFTETWRTALQWEAQNGITILKDWGGIK